MRTSVTASTASLLSRHRYLKHALSECESTARAVFGLQEQSILKVFETIKRRPLRTHSKWHIHCQNVIRTPRAAGTNTTQQKQQDCSMLVRASANAYQMIKSPPCIPVGALRETQIYNQSQAFSHQGKVSPSRFTQGTTISRTHILTVEQTEAAICLACTFQPVRKTTYVALEG